MRHQSISLSSIVRLCTARLRLHLWTLILAFGGSNSKICHTTNIRDEVKRHRETCAVTTSDHHCCVLLLANTNRMRIRKKKIMKTTVDVLKRSENVGRCHLLARAKNVYIFYSKIVCYRWHMQRNVCHHSFHLIRVQQQQPAAIITVMRPTTSFSVCDLPLRLAADNIFRD